MAARVERLGPSAGGIRGRPRLEDDTHTVTRPYRRRVMTTRRQRGVSRPAAVGGAPSKLSQPALRAPAEDPAEPCSPTARNELPGNRADTRCLGSHDPTAYAAGIDDGRRPVRPRRSILLVRCRRSLLCTDERLWLGHYPRRCLPRCTLTAPPSLRYSGTRLSLAPPARGYGLHTRCVRGMNRSPIREGMLR